MTPAYRPIARDVLIRQLVERVCGTSGFLRVAVDGPSCADPHALGDALVQPLREQGRPAVHLRACSFWHDASLRLEHGHEDVEAFGDWLDAGAVRREVLDPLVAVGRYLPSLRDPVTNRSTREAVRTAEPGTVLVFSGALLLGRELPFDLSVHLALSPAARARQTDPAEVWTLPAYDDYDASARPVERADVVVRMNDPRHPAVHGL